MIVGIYVRVSTAEQAKEGYSIGEQTERLEKYCQAHDWKIFKIYTDPGFSGKNTNRPALQNMIRDVRMGKLDMVLVYKLDRLSRSQKDTLTLIEDVFLKNNTDFNSMQENFDTSTPLGRAMIGILAVFAQLEREQIKERLVMGKDARAKEGKWIGGDKMPFGYDYIGKRLVINEYEAAQLKLMYKMAIDGTSFYQMAKELDEKGFKPRTGNWTEADVRRTMASWVPNGYIKYKKEWYKGIHEPIIDDVTFKKAQKAMKKRSEDHQNGNRNPGRASTYLGGFLVCGCCGNKYVKNGFSKKNKNGSVYSYNVYECLTKHPRDAARKARAKGRTCTNRNWNVDDLTAQVFDQIRLLSMDPEYIRDMSSVEDDGSETLMQEAVGKFEDQISRLMDLYALGNMPLDILQQKINEINDKKSRLEDELARIEIEKEQHMRFDEVSERVKEFPDILERGNFDEIRAVISDLIEKIVLTGDDITIYWRF